MIIKKLAAGLLAALMVASLAGCAEASPPKTNIVSASRSIGQARGFLVTEQDYFDNGGDTVEGQRTAMRDMLSFATDSKLNTIFFEARSGVSALYNSKSFATDPRVATGEKEQLDPLGELCSSAADSKVQVFAVIDPLSMSGSLPSGEKNPFEGLAISGDSLDPTDPKLHKLVATELGELAKRYNLTGIILSGLDASYMQGAEVTAGVDALVRSAAKSVQKSNPSTMLGVAFDASNEHNAMTVATVERLAADGVVQLVLPSIGGAVSDDTDKGYLSQLAGWTAAKLGTVDLYTVNMKNDPNELHSQLLANAMSGKVTGSVLAPYKALRDSSQRDKELLVSLLAAGKARPELTGLEITPTFVITYPQSGATVYSDTVWVMGTSDPSKPLTMEGYEITRGDSKGTFGVAVKVDAGENSFTIKQGDSSATVKIVRATAPSGTEPITKIREGSMFPAHQFGVNSNESFEVTCVGPAGASITATLAGETVVMTQTTATKTAGAPTTFKGSFTMNPASYPADAVTSAGKVTYVVSYKGNSDVQKSEGEVVVAGKNVPLVVERTDGLYVASVLTSLASDDNFTQALKSGARARVVGKARTTREGKATFAYKLSSGGFVLAEKVQVVENPADCTSDITEIAKESGDDWEQYTLVGGHPAVLTEMKEGKLTLRLLDTKLTADPATMAGGLIKAVTRTDTKDGAELLLEYTEGELWGYDITHGDGKTVLYLRRAPKRSDTFGKPLEGITVMLDPGHGGEDPGALGIAGNNGGPSEAIVNMAVANATKFRLEQLGATVSMTRADESVRVSLDERTYQAEREKPHLFIALHHNSTALSKDLTDLHHMEAYYWEAIALPLASNLMSATAKTTGRDTTEPENAYYYVTRLTFAPAVLYELGFMVNPAEYEEIASYAGIYEAANGIAAAVVETIEPIEPPVTETTVDNATA